MKLIFKKGKQISKVGENPTEWSDDRGYYFKGELLSRYKSEAFKIIRKRIEEAGNGSFLEGKEILKDEAKLLFNRMEDMNKVIKKTEESKKEYYLKNRIELKEGKVKRLINEIEKTKKELKVLKNGKYKMTKDKLTQEGKKYNEQSGNILQDFLDEGYKESDIIKAINYCSGLESFDQGDEILIFLKGIIYGRKTNGKK